MVKQHLVSECCEIRKKKGKTSKPVVLPAVVESGVCVCVRCPDPAVGF